MIAVCHLINKSKIIEMLKKAFIIKSAQKFLKLFIAIQKETLF